MEKTKFFRLVDDESIKDRWYLDAVESKKDSLSIDTFMSGCFFKSSDNLSVPVQYSGVPLDFTLSAFDVPIVRKEIADIFTQIAPENIQILPVEIDGDIKNYKIINVIKLIDCIDINKSKFDVWSEKDGLASKVGDYKTMYVLKIDGSKLGGQDHCFRVKDWEVALIVSELIKTKLEELNFLGLKFLEV